MAALGNTTFVQLKNVERVGFAYDCNSIYVKGSWFATNFSLWILDGFHAWSICATEKIIAHRAKKWYVSEDVYIEEAHLHLSEQKPDSIYSLHFVRDGTVRLLCTLGGEEKTRGLSIDLTLMEVPMRSVMIEMLQFGMDVTTDLKGEMAKTQRTWVRMTAALEIRVCQLENEKSKLQEKLELLKNEEEDEPTMEEERALHQSHASGKRVGAHDIERESAKRKSIRVVGPVSPSGQPCSPMAIRAIATAEGLSGLNGAAVNEVHAIHGQLQPRAGAAAPANGRKEGGPAGSNCGDCSDKGDLTEGEQSRESKWNEELSDCNAESQEDFSAAVNIEESVEGTPPHQVNLIDNQAVLYRFLTKNAEGKKKEYLSLKPQGVSNGLGTGEATGKKGTGREQTKARRKTPKKNGEAPPLYSTEGLVEEGMQVLAPFVGLGSPRVEAGGQRSQKNSPGKSNVKPTSSQKRTNTKKGNTGRNMSSLKTAEGGVTPQVSVWPAPMVLVMNTPTLEEQRQIHVVNADFHEFDEKRTEKDIENDQFWALYDDHDGMPRFYGRIRSVSHDPFEVSVIWLEPVSQAVKPSWLVPSASLSASCGEFMLASVCPQQLPAFSHRIDIKVDGKGVFRLYPGSGEVWALYKDWDKWHPQKGVDDLKYDYELVEVLSKFSKGKGVKVVPVAKVRGFKTLFKAGGDALSFWIPSKHVLGRFSHRIPAHRMHGSESPGVPTESWELDPASTPSDLMGVSMKEHHDTPVLAGEDDSS